MKLRQRILLILACVVGGYGISDHIVQRLTVLNAFDKIEQDFAETATVRVKRALEKELQLLQGRCADWAEGDGTSEYLEGSRPKFESQRLAEGVLGREGLDVLYLMDASGIARWGRLEDPDSDRVVAASEIKAFPEVGQKLDDDLRMGWRAEDRIRGLIRQQSGYLNTELGPLLVCTSVVSRSDGKGGTAGMVLLGRLVSKRMIKEIEADSDTVGLRVQFHDASNATEVENDYVATFAGKALIEEKDGEWLRVQQLLETSVGMGVAEGTSPAPLLLRAEVSRVISKQGKATVFYALVSTIAAGLILIWVLLGILQRTVLSPINHLMNNAVRIGQDDTADVRFDLEREDEIGVLSREFDHMMELLAASRAALVDTAREAGKSEIATGILHNVGNVLNSVNVSSSMLAKKAESLAIKDLQSLNAIIAEHAADLGTFISQDPRGKHFPPFLDALTGQLVKDKASITEEIRSLTGGIDRIRDLVNSQQDYVRRTEVIESCDLSAVLDKAISVSENVDSFHLGLTVEREYADLPKTPIDRYKVLEILVNLIQNARHAMEERGGVEHKLTIRLLSPDSDHIRIEVQDTGIGIAPENLAKIFDHGFTTKAKGHGFGLHSAANAATEMSGCLSARSDGPGHGATFVLELPTRAVHESAI